MAEKKKKKSIYSKKLKDINKDGKRNFKDTFLGDLLGADGKAGIKKGRPGLKASLKGARREDGKPDVTAKKVQKAKKKVTKGDSSGRTMDSVVNELRSKRKVTPAKPTRKDMTSVVDKVARDRNAAKKDTLTSRLDRKGVTPKDRRTMDSRVDELKSNAPAKTTAAPKKATASYTHAEYKNMTTEQRVAAGFPKKKIISSAFFNRYINRLKDANKASGFSKGGMAKKKAGYSKGGMTKRSGYAMGGSVSKGRPSNCGASMKPNGAARRRSGK